MASNKPYRDSKKVTPEKVTCAYYKKKPDPGLLFPAFTRDLYFSVFPNKIPDRRIGDGNPTDHTSVMKTMHHLGTGKMGKHYTVMRTDFTKYACTKPRQQDLSLVVVLTCVDSRRVDYVDAVRMIEPFMLDKHGNPFLCRVIMHFRDRVPYQVENYYCACEYWHEHASLCHIVQKNGSMPEEHARFYLAELASALDDIHSRGKILRCLAICMLLLEHNGHLKMCPYTLCDQNLDCGKPCDPLCKACGDQFYASPEVVFGVDVKPAADWWSFGVLMYQLLTGRLPFTGCTLGELGKAITEETPHLPPGLSPEAVDLLQNLLHKDPRRRLGWGDDGACAVKKHPFWSGIDWLNVPERYLEPPFRPGSKKTRI